MSNENFGFVNIIKPTGMTSFEVVSKVKKILKTKRVGHLGTLDPAASGVLPIAVGKATKFFDYFLNKDKEYFARVKFGIETDTLDSFGNITKIINKEVSEKDINEVLLKFTGEIMQVPPKYSAVKINGKRAYDLARENKDFEINPRKITIFDIKLVKICKKNEFLFKINCSAGTYIRTLFSDIAVSLGTVATTSVIIRTKSGNFDISSAKTIEEFERESNLIGVREILSSTPLVSLREEFAKKLLNGVKLTNENLGLSSDFCGDVLVEYKEKLVGLYTSENGIVKSKIFLYEE